VAKTEIAMDERHQQMAGKNNTHTLLQKK